MYSIVDRKSLRETEGFTVEITIHPEMEILEVQCRYPTNRKMSFDLLSKGSTGLIVKRYYPGGSALSIPLAPFNADNFEFKASDETGKTVVVYHIMRAFC
jgi:hypothetical protein